MASWAATAAIVPGPSELARTGIIVERGRPRAKLLLLGDAAAVSRALPAGVAIPLNPNTVVRTQGVGVCLWLRPDQRLLLLSADAAPLNVARIRTTNAPDAWVLDAGGRYVEFAVTGRGAAQVLNAACSLDLREAAFPVDSCAQSRFDQIPVVIFRSSRERFDLFAERPLADHLWLWMCRAVNDMRE
jgi:sarcosine oxidase subunit gamma